MLLVNPEKLTVFPVPGSAATVEPNCVSEPKELLLLDHSLKLVAPVRVPLSLIVAAVKLLPVAAPVKANLPKA